MLIQLLKSLSFSLARSLLLLFKQPFGLDRRPFPSLAKLHGRTAGRLRHLSSLLFGELVHALHQLLLLLCFPRAENLAPELLLLPEGTERALKLAHARLEQLLHLVEQLRALGLILGPGRSGDYLVHSLVSSLDLVALLNLLLQVLKPLFDVLSLFRGRSFPESLSQLIEASRIGDVRVFHNLRLAQPLSELILEPIQLFGFFRFRELHQQVLDFPLVFRERKPSLTYGPSQL